MNKIKKKIILKVKYQQNNTQTPTKTVNKSNNKITELRTIFQIRVITKLPDSEQSSKGKVKTHKYINRQKVKFKKLKS